MTKTKKGKVIIEVEDKIIEIDGRYYKVDFKEEFSNGYNELQVTELKDYKLSVSIIDPDKGFRIKDVDIKFGIVNMNLIWDIDHVNPYVDIHAVNIGKDK